MNKRVRPDWNEYFMNIATVVATRSSCVRRQVGAVIIRDNNIISGGYNGTPRGLPNCDEGGCARCNSTSAAPGQSLAECLCSHAEENAITQAAFHGASVRGSTLYSTFKPCLICSKMIINAGLTRVVFGEDYPDEAGTRLILASQYVDLYRYVDKMLVKIYAS